jgi:hypothetical protein
MGSYINILRLAFDPFQDLLRHFGNFGLAVGNILDLALLGRIEVAATRPASIERLRPAIDAELGRTQQLELGRVR